VKVAEVLRLLEREGWVLVRTRGSHRQFAHPTRTGKVTVAGKPRDTLHPKTLGSILRQAGVERP
jgi:predicted RNA binding protein YcfA (HicA-like mRNA interferase family)